MSRIVANILCHNDILYLKNLIPQVETFADRIIVVDDMSEDGTAEYLSTRDVERVEKKFNYDFAEQRNFALNMVDNGDWVFRIDSDELPTKHLTESVRELVSYFDSKFVDRLTVPIYHLTNRFMCKLEVGVELRLFKKNDSCTYIGKTHERIHGDFPGIQCDLHDQFSLVHFKYADPKKVEETKTTYVEKNIYQIGDLNRRLEMDSTFTPSYIEYSLNQELRDYLCTNPISRISEFVS